MRDAVLELLVGLAMIAIGFGLLWLFMGERALEYSATTAWAVGCVVVGGGSVGFLATREILQKRRAAAERRLLRGGGRRPPPT